MEIKDGVEDRLLWVFRDLFKHTGYSQFEVSMRLLKRGQKEVIIKAGKEYRFVVDFPGDENDCTCSNCR